MLIQSKQCNNLTFNVTHCNSNNKAECNTDDSLYSTRIANKSIEKNEQDTRILAINCGGSIQKKQKYIRQLADEMKVDILVITETKFPNENAAERIKKTMKGWEVELTSYKLKRVRTKGGTMIAYR